MVYDSVYEANNYLRSGVESESGTSSQTSTNSQRSIKGTSRQRLAQQFNTGHVLVGGNPTKVTWYMCKEGSPTGNVTAHIRTSAGVEREQSTTLVDSSSLGLIGGGLVAKEFTFTGNTILATGDMITAEFTGGSNGNEVQLSTDNTGAVTNSVFRQYTPTTWSDISGEALKFIVNYTTSYPDVRKQHFWEWFSGATLNSRWTTGTGNGSPTYAMDNSADGGFKISLGATGNYRGQIHFNGINQYSPTSSVTIGVYKFGGTLDDDEIDVGLSNSLDIPLSLGDCALGGSREQSSFMYLTNSTGGTQTNTASTVASDINYHSHKVECTTSNVQYSVDGVSAATNTTTRPTLKMQPYIGVRNNHPTTTSVNIRYFEAYNT